MAYYLFVDRPTQFNKDLKNWNELTRGQKRKLQRANRPKRLHQTLESAKHEAIRLAEKTKSKVMILEIVEELSFQSV